MVEVPTEEEKRKFAPLPEIVIPEELQQERRQRVIDLLSNPPQVTVLFVLDRSGTIAASGLYEDDALAAKLGLPRFPRLVRIAGIGNEVYHRYYDAMLELGEFHGLGQGITGEYGSDQLARFVRWIHEADDPQVIDVIAKLRQSIGDATSCAILDDVVFQGVVSQGVAPTLFGEAFGDSVPYDLESNRYLFADIQWFRKIIYATFARDFPQMSLRELAFFEEVAKGMSDQHYYANPLESHTLKSILEVAQYCGSVPKYTDRGETVPTEDLEWIVQKYGVNLLSLHQHIIATLTAQMHEVIRAYTKSGDIL